MRHHLLWAALATALEKGFGHVTLDAIAQRAGVSKGGLLHYFPNKATLIEALLSHYSAMPPSANSIKDVLHGNKRSCHIDPLTVAILIAAAENPSLLEPFADRLGVGLASGRASVTSRRWHILANSLARRLS